MESTIKIRALPSQTDPHVCAFEVDRPLLSEGVACFVSAQDAEQSILGKHLFAITGIQMVIVCGAMITIHQAGHEPWTTLGKQIGQAIRAALATDQPPISPATMTRSAPDHELGQHVRSIITDKINPALADHGGYIDLIDVSNGHVFLRMGGGCQGCASSTATLRQGVETTLKDNAPGIRMIHDITNHNAGVNPYYK